MGSVVVESFSKNYKKIFINFVIDKVTFIANPELFNIPYTYFLKIPSTIELKSIRILKISDQIYAEFENIQ